MNPDLTAQPNQGGAQTPPQGQSLDPSVVALAKAIGMAETPKTYGTPAAYANPSGDPGSPPSAYQFTPGFIDKWAPSILGNQYKKGNYNLAPAQQDELAYGAIKTMGTTGDPGYQHLGKLTAQQIASAWNSGDPNAYQDPEYKGVNKSGQSYNLPQYVSTVESNYNKLFPQGSGNAGSSLIPTANAASSATGNTQSSNGPSTLDWLLGGGAALGGWLLSEAKQPLIDAGTDATLGAVAGSVLPGEGTLAGAGAGALEGVVRGIISDVTGGGGGNNQQPPTTTGSSGTPQQPDYNSILSSLESKTPQANQAAKQLFNTQQEALATTIGGRQMTQDPQIQAGMQANAKYGFSPTIDETGSMNWQPAMQKSQQAVGNLSNQVKDVLIAEGGTAPLSFAVQEAKNQLRETTPSNEWEEGDREIEKASKQYEANFSDGKGNMSLGHYQLMKQELGHGKKWNMLETTARKQAHKALSTAARRTIEHHTQHKELYNRVMKEEQKLINGQKIMKRLNGKKAPHNKGLIRHLFQHGGQYVGLAIGDKIGGPLGAVLGSMVGDYVAKSVDKKYGKTIFETPAMHKSLDILKKQSPITYRLLEHELKKGAITYPQKRQSAKAILRKPTPRKPQARIKPRVQSPSESIPAQSVPQSK